MAATQDWTVQRQALLRRLHASAIILRDRQVVTEFTSQAPGLAGALGALLEETAASRRERARRFLRAERQPQDTACWQRVQAVLAGVGDLQALEVSPLLLLATPEEPEELPVLRRVGLHSSFDCELAADELLVHYPPIDQAPGDVRVVHVSPDDLALGFEQDRYCQLRCEGAPPDIAADIVRLALRH